MLNNQLKKIKTVQFGNESTLPLPLKLEFSRSNLQSSDKPSFLSPASSLFTKTNDKRFSTQRISLNYSHSMSILPEDLQELKKRKTVKFFQLACHKYLALVSPTTVLFKS